MAEPTYEELKARVALQLIHAAKELPNPRDFALRNGSQTDDPQEARFDLIRPFSLHLRKQPAVSFWEDCSPTHGAKREIIWQYDFPIGDPKALLGPYVAVRLD
jgi:hypothetical protein